MPFRFPHRIVCGPFVGLLAVALAGVPQAGSSQLSPSVAPSVSSSVSSSASSSGSLPAYLPPAAATAADSAASRPSGTLQPSGTLRSNTATALPQPSVGHRAIDAPVDLTPATLGQPAALPSGLEATRPTVPPWITQPDVTRRTVAVDPAAVDPALEPAAYETPVEPSVAAAGSPISRTPIGRDEAMPSSAPSLGGAVWGAVAVLIVLGLLAAGLLRGLRSKLPASLAPLPREACEVFGRRRLDARTQITLVRIDRRLLVLGVGPDGANTLAEIDDPVEIDRLAGLCRLNQSAAGAPSAFGSLLAGRLRRPTSSSDDPNAPADLNREAFAPPDAIRPDPDPPSQPTPRRLRPGQRLDVTTP